MGGDGTAAGLRVIGAETAHSWGAAGGIRAISV